MTRFAHLGRRGAAIVLSCVLAAFLASLAVSLQAPLAPAMKPGGTGDQALYEAVVQRLRSGDSYYDALGAELRARGYGSRSILNWRTPLHLWLVAQLPGEVEPRLMVGAVAVFTLMLSFRLLYRDGGRTMAFAQVLVLGGALLGCFPAGGYLFAEFPAGVLIALSACCYALGKWRPGMAAALLALFLRELAAPYVLLCMALAWRQRRRGELLTWLVGGAVYATYFALHAWTVTRHLTAADTGYPTGWVQWGALRFILATARMNAWLMTLPPWVTAAYVPLALLGLGGWSGAAGRRFALATGLYVALFAVVGKPFNDYWGLLCTPLLSFGAVWSFPALRDLARGLRATGTLTGGRP